MQTLDWGCPITVSLAGNSNERWRMPTPDWTRPITVRLGGNSNEGWDCDVEIMVWTPFRGTAVRKRGPYHGSTAQQAITEAFTELSAEGL